LTANTSGAAVVAAGSLGAVESLRTGFAAKDCRQSVDNTIERKISGIFFIVTTPLELID